VDRRVESECRSASLSGPTQSDASHGRPSWLLPLIIVVLAVAVYRPTLTYGFLALDDVPFVVNNPALQHADAASVRTLLTPGAIAHEVLYMPVTYLSFFVERTVLELDATGMHLVNILLHALNGVLLWLLLNRLGLRRTAGIGALLFIAHPLTAEPVSWIMGRKDLLAVVFGLGSLITYLQYRHTGSRRMLLGSLITAVLAMLAKPTLIILPVLLIACDRLAEPDTMQRYLRNKLPFAAAAALVYMLNMLGPTALNPSPYSLVERLAAVPAMFGGVTMRAALLQPCGTFYSWEAGTGGAALALGGALIVIGLAALHQAWTRQLHALFVGGCIAAFGLLPAMMAVMSSQQARDFITADRYAYLPLIGLVIAVCAVGERCSGQLLKAWYAAATVGLLLCLMLTPVAVAAWQNDTALWKRAVEQNPAVAMTYVQLAGAQVQARQYEAAINTALAALKLNPNSAFARRHAGDAWRRLGNPAKARSFYQQALKFKPSDGPSHVRLITMALDSGNLQEASVRAAAGAAAAPHDATVLMLYGVTAERRNDVPIAIDAYTRSLAINPQQPTGQYNLGNLCLQTNQLDLAEARFREALRLMPHHGGAAVNLGTVYIRKQKWREASSVIARHPATLTTHPGPSRLVQAQAALGMRDPPTAHKALKEAVEKAPLFVPCHQLLARLELATGNREAAAKAYAVGVANGAPKDPVFEAQLAGEKPPVP
jgi:tetratricopeptide (TPR) repeat protein